MEQQDMEEAITHLRTSLATSACPINGKKVGSLLDPSAVNTVLTQLNLKWSSDQWERLRRLLRATPRS